MGKTTPCDFVDEYGHSYCPYSHDYYNGGGTDMCRNMCGLGVDEDAPFECDLGHETENENEEDSDMEKKMNGRYEIILEAKCSDELSIVLGKKEGGLTPYVTWEYNGYSYYWGHYFENLNSAKDDYAHRIQDLMHTYHYVVYSNEFDGRFEDGSISKTKIIGVFHKEYEAINKAREYYERNRYGCNWIWYDEDEEEFKYYDIDDEEMHISFDDNDGWTCDFQVFVERA